MRILFFTPLAARNGAEMMLWYIIRYIDRSRFQVAVYSLADGVLLKELPEGVPFYTAKPLTAKRKLQSKLQAFAGKSINLFEADILEVHNSFKPDLWYLNTLLCYDVGAVASKHSIPFAVHFHELLLLYQHISYTNLKTLVDKAQLLIGCASVVCEKLTIMGGVNIALQYECVDFKNIVVNSANTSAIRQELNIQDSFVWVMSGSMEYRKGADLISGIAKALGRKITIVWLGPGASGFTFYIEQELKYYGLDNVKVLGGKSGDYYDYLSLADGLILTSREDPFPLVMLESGYLGKPIVSFNSGGAKEFLQENTGIIVESNNLKDYIDAMQRVMNGSFAFDKQKAIERAKEFDVSNQVKHWQKVMLNFNKN